MTLITLIFACLGFLSPANRGALMTCALVLYVCLGTPAGYVSSRIYKSFGGERWKLNVLLTSMLCPGYCQLKQICTIVYFFKPVVYPHRIVFGVFFILNLVLWSKGSSGAISFGILVALLALWFGISVPLTFVGAFFGFRKRVSFRISFEFFICLPINLIYIYLNYSQLNTQFGRTRSHDRFPTKVFTRVRLRVSSWAAFYLSDASSFNYFSYSTHYGPIRCITCLDSSFWSSSFWSSLVRKQLSCSATFICVLRYVSKCELLLFHLLMVLNGSYRTTTGGGAAFWQAVLQPFTCSCTAFTILSQNWKLQMLHLLSFTLDTHSLWFSCSSYFQVKKDLLFELFNRRN